MYYHFLGTLKWKMYSLDWTTHVWDGMWNGMWAGTGTLESMCLHHFIFLFCILKIQYNCYETYFYLLWSQLHFKLDLFNKNEFEKYNQHTKRKLNVHSVPKITHFLALQREGIGWDILGICSFKDKDNSLHTQPCEQDAMRLSSKPVWFCKHVLGSYRNSYPPHILLHAPSTDESPHLSWTNDVFF